MNKIVKGVVPDGDSTCRFDSNILEKELKDIIGAKLGDENACMEESGEDICPTFVVATSGLHAEGPPTIIRSYKCKGAGPMRCAIWEAGRATSASPLFFKPIHIAKPAPGRTFVDGGLANNNPSELALREGQRRWPETKRFCLTSIGTGRQKSIRLIETGSMSSNSEVRSLSRNNTWSGPRTVDKVELGLNKLHRIMDACAKLSQSSETVHQRVLTLSLSRGLSRGFDYHRFSVDRDMDEVELQEWHKKVEIAEHTVNYMSEGEGEQKRDKCVEDLLKAEEKKKSASTIPASTYLRHDTALRVQTIPETVHLPLIKKFLELLQPLQTIPLCQIIRSEITSNTKGPLPKTIRCSMMTG